MLLVALLSGYMLGLVVVLQLPSVMSSVWLVMCVSLRVCWCGGVVVTNGMGGVC